MKLALGFSLLAILFPGVVFAEDHAVVTTTQSAAPWIALAVGFGMALAVMAATTAQGRIASAFLDGASRNPGAADGMKTPLILGLAFIESLVLFTVLIAFMLIGKL